MSNTEILEKALKLPAAEKFLIVDSLLKSLDVPDPKLDDFWADEALRRFEAYKAGEIGGVPVEEIFDKNEVDLLDARASRTPRGDQLLRVGS